ncbi:MAG TPA: hypothetical protein VK034_20265 [Enhygromyxa sp.]|nr:hypothetical protein [Enhygromyxa sp.]
MFKKYLDNTWTMSVGLTLGILLLMISIRPELQARPGSDDDSPGSKVAIAGHVLTWTTGAALTYRMVRSIQAANRETTDNNPDGNRRPPEPPTSA